MVTEVYLQDNKDEGRIEVVNLETGEALYHYSYRIEGTKIWSVEDAWRILRHTHMRKDLYKEVFKCKCGKIVRIPDKIEADIDEVNSISVDLKCECGEIIIIKCDTLVVGEKGD